MTISVIIPTLNESANITGLLDFLTCESKGIVKELIVVDAGSTDETVKLAKSHGVVVLETQIKNRAVQMNLGADLSTADVLYFIHADVKLLPDFAQDINNACKSGFQAGCFSYSFDSKKALLRLNAYFTKFNGVFCGGGDQTLFIDRKVFKQLNGFNEHFCIMEDFEFTRRIKKKYSFKLIQKRIVVSARKYDNNSWLRVQMANILVFTMFFLKFHPCKMKLTYNYLLKPIQ
jgi:rSAM/selenodomain-associated transferase 2